MVPRPADEQCSSLRIWFFPVFLIPNSDFSLHPASSSPTGQWSLPKISGWMKASVHLLAQSVGDDKIVDAPADVLLPGVEAVAPPGVFRRVGMLEAPGIGEAGGQQLGELAPLLVGEAGVAPVGLGVFQVDLLMGHVQVPAVDHGLDRVELLHVFAQGVLPAHAEVDPLEPVLGVRGVAGEQVEILVFQRDQTALVVELLHADTVGHGQGLVLREHRRAGIALLLRGAPVLLVAGQVQRELARLHFGLLQAENVGVQGLELSSKPLSTQARRPLTFQEMNFMAAPLLREPRASARAALRRRGTGPAAVVLVSAVFTATRRLIFIPSATNLAS